MAAPVDHLLYLHGFRSSPMSTKGRLIAGWVDERRASGHPLVWEAPQLPPSPAEAVDDLLQRLGHWPTERSAVIGSSLGGFYATVLAEALGWRAVLVNPAIEPARDLAGYLGELTAWHDPSQRFLFTREHVQSLQSLRPGAITRPERYFLMAARGDEVLDADEMQVRYAGCRQLVLDGGDHAFTDFPSYRSHVFNHMEWHP